MNQNILRKVRIVELKKDDSYLLKLSSHYITNRFYDLAIVKKPDGWRLELVLKQFDKPVKKSYTGTLFENHIEEPRVFAAVLNDDQIGWIELGYEKWNNRMRVWEFLVKKEFRRKGIGGLLMEFAIKIAKERGARMLVLETQSCDAPAIAFYLMQGFNLIGFDSTAYSNEDIGKREVRLEMGRLL